jgi:hypothetical protein
MISPMVEPSRKNLKGKAFRFGIFRGQFVSAGAGFVFDWLWKLARLCWRDALHDAPESQGRTGHSKAGLRGNPW